jgi:hypothetical protein
MSVLGKLRPEVKDGLSSDIVFELNKIYDDHMTILCKNCNHTRMTTLSVSGTIGGGYCFSCRKKIVPKHIPEIQHRKYLYILLESQNVRKRK